MTENQKFYRELIARDTASIKVLARAKEALESLARHQEKSNNLWRLKRQAICAAIVTIDEELARQRRSISDHAILIEPLSKTRDVPNHLSARAKNVIKQLGGDPRRIAMCDVEFARGAGKKTVDEISRSFRHPPA